MANYGKKSSGVSNFEFFFLTEKKDCGRFSPFVAEFPGPKIPNRRRNLI